MLSLVRSVITQATRGGRLVVSRRNFCSSTLGRETMEEMEKRKMRAEIRIWFAIISCATAMLGYSHGKDSRRIRETEKLLRESVGAASSKVPTTDN